MEQLPACGEAAFGLPSTPLGGERAPHKVCVTDSLQYHGPGEVVEDSSHNQVSIYDFQLSTLYTQSAPQTPAAVGQRKPCHPPQPCRAYTSYASLPGILAKIRDGTPGIEEYFSIEKYRSLGSS
ncbi:uncharacterized protein ACIGJ3_003745 [Trichechus inunguis]